MKKHFRLLSVLLTLAMLLYAVPLPMTAHAATWYYTVTNGEASITDLPTGTTGDVFVPSEINGYPVTSISRRAFDNCNITSVNIPNSVSSIGEYAFNYCAAMTNITIPNSVESIGHNAFRDCVSLTEITIPGSVNKLETSLFYNCTKLQNVHLSEGICDIGNYTFYGCESLQEIALPNSVTTIGHYAFACCWDLTRIRIESNVTSLGDGVFNGTEDLEIRFFGTESQWEAIEKGNNAIPSNATVRFLTPYYITYDANGGSHAPQNQYDGDGAKISGQIPKREGYWFRGWSTSVDGEAEYQPGDCISVQSNLTLYAVWLKEYTCKVVYDARGGTGCDTEETVVPFCPFRIYQTPTMEGFEFLGWATSSGGQVEYRPLDELTITEDLYLYAVWQHACSVCSGIGHSSKLCSVCGGEGGSGTQCQHCGADGTITRYCIECGGAGSLHTDCSTCDTTGKVLVEKYIDCRQCSGKGCGSCGYSGIEYSLGYQTCSTCKGTGYTRTDCSNCISGVISESTCKNCDGDGWAVWNVCTACEGTKWEYYQRSCASCGGDGVILYVEGNLNFDGDVNEDDAIYLLQHVLLPDIFTVSQNVDYNKDDTVDEDDAIYLLQHVLLPDLFPIS